jgi:hypothetical protein
MRTEALAGARRDEAARALRASVARGESGAGAGAGAGPGAGASLSPSGRVTPRLRARTRSQGMGDDDDFMALMRGDGARSSLHGESATQRSVRFASIAAPEAPTPTALALPSPARGAAAARAVPGRDVFPVSTQAFIARGVRAAAGGTLAARPSAADRVAWALAQRGTAGGGGGARPVVNQPVVPVSAALAAELDAEWADSPSDADADVDV